MLYYDALNGVWQRLPFSFDAANPKAVTASVYHLGTFVVVASDLGPDPGALDSAETDATPIPSAGSIYWYNGAIRINNHALTHDRPAIHQPVIVYLVVETFTPKYSWQTGPAPHTVLCSGWDAPGAPADETVIHLTQGTYEFCVTVTEYYIPPISIGRKWMYPDMIIVTVDEPAHNRYQMRPEWEGAVNFPIPDPDNWSLEEVPCTRNDSATVSWCTGDLQCTLTWINRPGSVTDYDLNLYGPEGMHVYHDDKVYETVKLDRDHTSGLGQTVENICNTVALPAGSYRVMVKNYWTHEGSPGIYRLTVIDNRVPRSWTGTLANLATRDCYTFTR